MSKWDGMNRRKFPRVNYPCLVTIRDGQETSDTMLTHTENVGIGGVCVILKKYIKIFCPIDIELDLMDMGDHIQCQGRVVWNVQRKADAPAKPLFYDIGIEFQNISQQDIKRIEVVVKQLVKNHKETPYK